MLLPTILCSKFLLAVTLRNLILIISDVMLKLVIPIYLEKFSARKINDQMSILALSDSPYYY